MFAFQEFLKKKQAAANANGTVPGSTYNRNWYVDKHSASSVIMWRDVNNGRTDNFAR